MSGCRCRVGLSHCFAQAELAVVWIDQVGRGRLVMVVVGIPSSFCAPSHGNAGEANGPHARYDLAKLNTEPGLADDQTEFGDLHLLAAAFPSCGCFLATKNEISLEDLLDVILTFFVGVSFEY